MAKQKIEVDGLSISINKEGYVSLTDIAKKSSDIEPSQMFRSWLRNQDTINYLETWETIHNDNFKPVQMDRFRKNAASNRTKISAQSYIEQTGAIGIVSKSGRYGGTYSHSDIAIEFCAWISPEFKVYFQKEFQRLKHDESVRLGLTFDLRRELTKTNYYLQTEAIDTLLTDKVRSKEYKTNAYASEADLLNVVVFGTTAKQWRAANSDKKGNIRDYASIDELLLLLNMESLNATMISWEYDQEMRAEILKIESNRQRPIIAKNKAVKRIQAQDKKKLK